MHFGPVLRSNVPDSAVKISDGDTQSQVHRHGDLRAKATASHLAWCDTNLAAAALGTLMHDCFWADAANIQMRQHTPTG